MGRKTVELVVPCFNEEACAGLFYDAVEELFSKTLTAYDFQLIYVDDGSSDGTLDKIKEITAKAPEGRVHCISRFPAISGKKQPSMPGWNTPPVILWR